MVQQGGLGRGLASLIPSKKNQNKSYLGKESSGGKSISGVKKIGKGESATVSLKENPAMIKDIRLKSILEVSVDDVSPNPFQPRKIFDKQKLQELADSIKTHGLLQPLVVTQNKQDQYELIAGERRLEASKLAGIKKVPVIVKKANNQKKMELSLVENLQRHDLNAIEEAKAFQQLHDEIGLTQEEIAARVGKSRSAVANVMRLLKLPIEIQKAIFENKISEGHARALAGISNQEKQLALFKLTVQKGLTVRQIEERAKEVVISEHTRKVRKPDPDIQEKEKQLSEALGTKVKIKKKNGSGQVLVDFYSNEEFEAVCEKIKS